MVRFFTLGLLLAFSISCGRGLVPGDFEGDPAFVKEALICGDNINVEATRPTVAIAWKRVTPDGMGLAFDHFQPVEAVVFPATIEYELRAAPHDVDVVGIQSESGTFAANIGCPVVFDDRDNDGLMGSSDPMIAIGWNQLIVHRLDEPLRSDSEVMAQPIQQSIAEGPKFLALEGVCDEQEQPAGLKARTAPLDLNLLELPGAIPETPPIQSCVQFF